MKVLELKPGQSIRVGITDGVMYATDEKYEIEWDGVVFIIIDRKDKERKATRIFPTNVQYFVLADDEQLRVAAPLKKPKVAG